MIVGVDIGGTKISITLGDKEGNLFHSIRLQTSSFRDAKEGIEAIKEAIYKLLSNEKKAIDDIEAMGIAAPGPIDTKKGKFLTPPNLPSWHGYSIVSPFEKAFNIPVYFNNDANGAALAEYLFGHMQKSSTLIYLTASTGMGGGIVIDGKLLQGSTDTGGEVGHIILDRDGPICPCGLQGCFEAFCGGINVARRIQQDLEAGTHSSILGLADGNLENIDMAILVEAVKEKDSYAISVWDEFVERMAQGIGALLMAFNPDTILLGTIAVHAKEVLMNPLLEKMTKYSWKEPLSACKIELSQLGSINHQLSPIAIAAAGLREKS